MNNNTFYDIAIIGGGLAGLCLAIQCAQENYKVVLFEKEEYPFHKVCGEYISLESWNFLQRLGANLQNSNLPIIKNLQLSDAKGASYSFMLSLGGVGVSRFYLDNRLYQTALSAGVTVFTKTKVTNVTFSADSFLVESAAGTNVRAKVAAGCYGKKSNLDVKWNRSFLKQKPDKLNNYIGIKHHVRYAHAQDQIALHNFENGYCGLSKIEDDKSCLCYLTTAKNLKDCGNSVGVLQKQVLYKNPRLREIFTKAEFLYDEPLAISQISFKKKAQVENHVLMLGDAAGMITPLCGNGMSMAMHSSKLAFEAIQPFLRGLITRAELEQNYALKWQNNFSRRLWVGRNVQRLFGGNTSTSMFLKTMYAVPWLSKKIIHSTHGRAF